MCTALTLPWLHVYCCDYMCTVTTCALLWHCSDYMGAVVTLLSTWYGTAVTTYVLLWLHVYCCDFTCVLLWHCCDYMCAALILLWLYVCCSDTAVTTYMLCVQRNLGVTAPPWCPWRRGSSVTSGTCARRTAPSGWRSGMAGGTCDGCPATWKQNTVTQCEQARSCGWGNDGNLHHFASFAICL